MDGFDDPVGFGSGLNEQIATDAGGRAYFGLDVLAGLTSQLAEAARQRRSEPHWGPAVLGCAMWMDDPDLIAVLHQMANVCVAVTKQTRVKFDQPGTQPLVELAAERGLGQSAYPELDGLAARDASGDALMVGPYTPDWRQTMSIGGVREVGYRRSGNRLVPIVHSKIMLLGQMWWSDEHPSGHTVDQIGFRPEWLWLGSPNFTKASRRSLETGMWIKDPSMLLAARKFLLGLVAMSEPLGAGPDLPEPQLVPVSYDDQAMSEYFAEHRYDYFEEEA